MERARSTSTMMTRALLVSARRAVSWGGTVGTATFTRLVLDRPAHTPDTVLEPDPKALGHPFPAPSPFTYNKQASSIGPTQDRGSVLWREQAAMAQGWCKCTSEHTPSARSQLPMHTTKPPSPVPLLPAPKGQATHRRWAVGHLHWGSEEGVCLVHGIHSQPSCPLIRALR